MLGTSFLILLVLPPAKAGGSNQNTMLIMWEPLIMQEPLIIWEPESGCSWTSKVFNTVIFSWELNFPKLSVIEEVQGTSFHGLTFLWD